MDIDNKRKGESERKKGGRKRIEDSEKAKKETFGEFFSLRDPTETCSHTHVLPGIPEGDGKIFTHIIYSLRGEREEEMTAFAGKYLLSNAFLIQGVLYEV